MLNIVCDLCHLDITIDVMCFLGVGKGVETFTDENMEPREVE